MALSKPAFLNHLKLLVRTHHHHHPLGHAVTFLRQLSVVTLEDAAAELRLDTEPPLNDLRSNTQSQPRPTPTTPKIPEHVSVLIRENDSQEAVLLTAHTTDGSYLYRSRSCSGTYSKYVSQKTLARRSYSVSVKALRLLEELDASCKNGDVKEAVKVLGGLEQHKIQVEMETYVSLIHKCGESQAFEEAEMLHN